MLPWQKFQKNNARKYTQECFYIRSPDGYYRPRPPDKANGLVLKLIKAVVEALAKMHEADPTNIGLESYGKLEGYLKRNET